MFYSVVSQAYEGIAAVTPSILRSTTLVTTHNTNKIDHDEQRNCANDEESDRDEISTTGTARALFPSADTSDADSISNADKLTICTSAAMGDCNTEGDSASAASTANQRHNSAYINDIDIDIPEDTTSYTRAQSAHVEYCDIYG
jgi:hypothetical protein